MPSEFERTRALSRRRAERVVKGRLEKIGLAPAKRLCAKVV